jgi:tripartite-type tricarboxylate transporter receptor subunit TctC
MFSQRSRRSTWVTRLSAPGKSARRSARRLRSFVAFATSVMALVAPISARADWPERQVKIIVTFPPGSANDAAARIFADALGKKWGKPVIVEDRPGGEGTIGVGSFIASQDDHTLLYTVGGSITVAPMLVEKLPYDVNRDLVPISATTAIALTLTVSNQLSVNSISELIEALRANPGKYAWTSGPTLPRFVFSAFLKRHDLKMSFVSYRDASQPQADLGEGRIQALVTSWAASSSPVQAGKARFLAVLNPSRAATLPDIKTVRELGYPELEIEGLAGIFGSKITPQAVLNKVAADVAAICSEADIRRKLEVGGHIVLSGTTEELVAGIGTQRSAMNELAKIIDIRNPQ